VKIPYARTLLCRYCSFIAQLSTRKTQYAALVLGLVTLSAMAPPRASAEHPAKRQLEPPPLPPLSPFPAQQADPALVATTIGISSASA
jgi:hypothetical protein